MSFFGKKADKIIEQARVIQSTMTDDEKREVEEINKTPVDSRLEFMNWMKMVHSMSVAPFSLQEQRAKLAKYLSELSEDAYIAYFPQIVSIIQKSKEKCVAFKNSEEQVENILSWLPRLKDHKELLLLYIKERRKKYRLMV